MANPKLTAADAGCWLSGTQGWHNNYQVVQIAEGLGFVVNNDDQRMIDIYRIGGDIEEVVNYLLKEKFGEAKAQGLIPAAWPDAVRREAEALIESANGAVTDQGGLCDKATEHLDSLAPDGFSFLWDDGLTLLCLCQIEGTEENQAVMKSDSNSCDDCRQRWAR